MNKREKHIWLSAALTGLLSSSLLATMIGCRAEPSGDIKYDIRPSPDENVGDLNGAIYCEGELISHEGLIERMFAATFDRIKAGDKELGM